MKNAIIFIVGLLLLAVLIGVAYVKFDSANGEFPSDQHVEEPTESTSESTSESEEVSETTAPTDSYEFTVEDMDGNLVKRTDITGKPMVVHFWASWCGYCLYELPVLQTMYEEYGDVVTFMVVCITDGEYETVESAKEFLADKNYTFPIYFDVQSEALHNYQLYDLSNTSRTYLFDIDGNYVSKANRTIDEDMLEEGIAMILPQ